ncbi:hypothetical protein ABZ840_07640 [Streptomyces sp. NPDC047117]|uniref:hypothetical protein n=1 Tax=Streptomyces sp. NPDC047117 TaxID=3155379 RepID=UPI0033EB9FBE
MYARTKATVGVASVGIMLFGTAGTATATTAETSTAPAQHRTVDAKDRLATVKFNKLNSRGASGWIRNNTSSGCYKAVVWWYKNGRLKDTDQSKPSCSKGKKVKFAFKPGDKYHFKATSWQHDYVGGS